MSAGRLGCRRRRSYRTQGFRDIAGILGCRAQFVKNHVAGKTQFAQHLSNCLHHAGQIFGRNYDKGDDQDHQYFKYIQSSNPTR